MRLWHYKLIPVLPDKMLVSQWRECIAIKRQWEKGTLKHRLVSYVKDYAREYFLQYVQHITWELRKRNIKYQEKLTLTASQLNKSGMELPSTFAMLFLKKPTG